MKNQKSGGDQYQRGGERGGIAAARQASSRSWQQHGVSSSALQRSMVAKSSCEGRAAAGIEGVWRL